MLTAASTAGMTITPQESKLESARNFANKIWNAARFVLLNCDDIFESQGAEPLDWETELAPPELADLWILSRFNRVALDVHNALAEFRFHEAASTLYHFFWDDFCDWYIELSKPHVTAKEPTPQATAVKRRIVYVLERSLRLLHPIMPFITEELWQRLPHRGETICLAEFISHNSAQLDGRAEREMALVIGVITKLRNIRSTFNLAPSVALKAQIAPGAPSAGEVIAQMEEHIKRLARIEELQVVEKLETRKGSARAVVGVCEIAVPLEGLIDFDRERARLDKELSKLNNERAGLEKRLAKPDFINRAAAEVVASTRARADELTDQITKLRAMIEAL
jgi:valyl-tRNA synthetase